MKGDKLKEERVTLSGVAGVKCASKCLPAEGREARIGTRAICKNTFGCFLRFYAYMAFAHEVQNIHISPASHPRVFTQSRDVGRS